MNQCIYTKLNMPFVRCRVPIAFLAILTTVSAQANFFEHGTVAGDKSLAAGNDMTGTVELPDVVIFPFYGKNHSRLYIQTNGLVSFNESSPEPPTDKLRNNFPLDPNRDEHEHADILIAPFWADVDTTDQRGAVYYRQRQSGRDLFKATAMVRRDFPKYLNFKARWVLIVTWANVSFFDHARSSAFDPRNTFQAALITNNVKSFVFLVYDAIEWTTGTTLSGDPVYGNTTYLALQAIVGFNKGDGRSYSTAGLPDDRLKLPVLSNIDQPGTYAYQVDGENITEAGCPDDESSCEDRRVSNTPTYPIPTTTVEDKSTTPAPGGLSTGAIIGIIIIIIVVGIIGISVMIVVLYRRKRMGTANNANVQYRKASAGANDDTTENA